MYAMPYQVQANMWKKKYDYDFVTYKAYIKYGFDLIPAKKKKKEFDDFD